MTSDWLAGSLKHMKLFHGDCLETLKSIPDNSIDSVVTDPPYGISFMGKKWDYDVPSVELWRECMRVLKPGGHMLVACGTRTQHRMAVNIEDAGFEIRDVITWLYGSGFPKSHNGAWGGTALKPACEFWTLARKPIEGTVAKNFEKYGTGGLNIDGCRVELQPGEFTSGSGANQGGTIYSGEGSGFNATRVGVPNIKSTVGRFPANLILDEEAAKALDEQSGTLKSGKPVGVKTSEGYRGGFGNGIPVTGFGDTGGASRFFYVAKASKSERGTDNNHPTVKPIKLMRYLCRLITPKGGTVLDPFLGSGSTLVAAKLEGFQGIGIERESEYLEIARRRIDTVDLA